MLASPFSSPPSLLHVSQRIAHSYLQAEADALQAKIHASGVAEADIVKAKGSAEAERLRAEGSKAAADLLSTSEVAVELAKMDRSAMMLNGGEKYFFGQEPNMLSNIFMKKGI
jgi:hypothetical protein